MRKLDYIFAWILLLLGCIHCAGTFIVFKSATLEAIWFFTGGLTVIFGALLNMVRIVRPEYKLTVGLSLLANLLLFAVFVIVVPWVLHYEFKHNPQVIVVGLTIAAELFFSIKLFLSK